MQKQLIAKILLSIAGLSLPGGGWFFDAVQVPPTHLFNPAWPPHARYHSACWLFALSLAVIGALWLLWGRYPERDSRLAVWGAAFLPGLFYFSFLPALLIPGTSVWNDGEAAFQALAPQIIIALAMLVVLGLGLLLDGRARRAAPAAAR